MTYNMYAPSTVLSPYIKHYWMLESEETLLHPQRERIFPDGCLELIFHYGDVFRKYIGGGENRKQARGFVHGQLTTFMEVEPTGKVGVFSIRFTPEGLHRFLPININEITRNDVCVEDLWGNDGIFLEEEIMEASGSEQRIEIIERFLMKRMSFEQAAFGAIGHCVRAIFNSRGSVSIDALSNEVNMGRRHLERTFLNRVGLPPKLFARIVRFQHALKAIENHSTSSFTKVAHDVGFYDQSHFIRDFKEFTGLNPKQYFATNLEFAKYLLLA